MNLHEVKLMSPEERVSFLDTYASNIQTEHSYMKPLTDDEVTEQRALLSEAAIEQSDILDEKKEAMAEFKARLAPVEQKLKVARTAVKQRGMWVKGKVYLIPNYDDKTMTMMNADGHVIETRPMKPEERQFLLSHNQKSA